MNRETTDKIILYARNTESGYKIRLDLDLERSRQTPDVGYHVDERRRRLTFLGKALFVKIRPFDM